MTDNGGSGMRPAVRISKELSVTLGTLLAAPVVVAPSPSGLLQEMEQLATGLRDTWAGSKPSEIAGLAPARELYRSFGIDPTRIRPSSEALLRRVLKGKPLPRICNAVDLCNLCSLRFLLPIGLYDASSVSGGMILREGKPGESFRGIRKDDVHLHGRPVLADDIGPFGNPTSDSLRTSVTESTSGLYMVIFAPQSVRSSTMEEHVRYANDRIVRFLGDGDRPVQVDIAVQV